MTKMIVDVRPYPVLDAAKNVLVRECQEIEMNAVVFNLSLLAGEDWELTEAIAQAIEDLQVIHTTLDGKGSDADWVKERVRFLAVGLSKEAAELRKVWVGS